MEAAFPSRYHSFPKVHAFRGVIQVMNHIYGIFGMHSACYGRQDASITAKSQMSPTCHSNTTLFAIHFSDMNFF